MKYYLDSAKLNLIEYALKKYELDGVTTNPTILARDIEKDMSLSELLYEIRRLTKDKKLFVQVTSDTADEMIRDAEKIVSVLGGDLCIKVPSTTEGFEAIKILKTESIKTTATACYSTSQAMLAAKAGAEFVAPYISHLDNMSQTGADVAGEMARQFNMHSMHTEVLAASFRTASQIENCIANGVSAVTVTAEMLDVLATHLGTVNELNSFKKNWNARFDKGIAELLS